MANHRDHIPRSDYLRIANKILPPDLNLIGQATTPEQRFFQQMFPWKVIQLRLAMTHGEDIKRLMLESNSTDGQLYNEATRELWQLHSQSLAFDELSHQDWHRSVYLPWFGKYTDFYQAPHLKDTSRKQLVALAAKDAVNLKCSARNLSFGLRD